MDIKTLLDEAIKEDDINLQALIMFLVFEKQVLTMEQQINELDRYFLEKHRNRMNDELTNFKNKMNMKEPASTFKVNTKDERTIYVFVQNEHMASSFVNSLGLYPVDAEYAPSSNLMLYEGRYQTLDEITKGKQAPCYIGENTTEINYRR